MGSHLIISENPDYAPDYNVDTFSSGFGSSEIYSESQDFISETESQQSKSDSQLEERNSLFEPEDRSPTHRNNLVYDNKKWINFISESEQKSKILADSHTSSVRNPSSVSNPTSQTFQMEVKPLLAGTAGGVLSTLLLHPLDNIKIRCAAGKGTCINHFRSIRSSPEGLRGFYKGMSPNLTLSAFSWATYFFT